MASLAPPASPYSRPPSMQQAYKLLAIDFERSYHDYFVFNEDEVVMRDQVLSLSSCIVFDVKRFNFKARLMQHFGFAVLPLVE